MGYDAALPGLSLTQKQAEDLIRDHLEPKHCVRGPEPEDQNPDTACVCIFRLRIERDDCDAYVKLALRLTRSKSGQLRGIIWSFKNWNEADRTS